MLATACRLDRKGRNKFAHSQTGRQRTRGLSHTLGASSRRLHTARRALRPWPRRPARAMPGGRHRHPLQRMARRHRTSASSRMPRHEKRHPLPWPRVSAAKSTRRVVSSHSLNLFEQRCSLLIGPRRLPVWFGAQHASPPSRRVDRRLARLGLENQVDRASSEGLPSGTNTAPPRSPRREKHAAGRSRGICRRLSSKIFHR